MHECSITQWYLIISDPTDCSPSGPSAHGISQARILEWVAVSSSRASSQPRDPTPISYTGRRIFFYHCTTKEVVVLPANRMLKAVTFSLWLWQCFLSIVHCSAHLTLAVCAGPVASVMSVCDPMDCNPPGSSVHGILLARILEWVATPSSRGSSQLRDQTGVSCISCVAGRFFIVEPQGKPQA